MEVWPSLVREVFQAITSLSVLSCLCLLEGGSADAAASAPSSGTLTGGLNNLSKIVSYCCSSFGCGGHNSFNTLVLSSKVITYHSSLLQVGYDISHPIFKCRLWFFGTHKVVYSIKHNHKTEIRYIKACVIQIRKKDLGFFCTPVCGCLAVPCWDNYCYWHLK